MLTYATMILAAEEGDSGGLDLLLPASEELIAGIIAFSIVFFFIWKWAIPALIVILAARQAEIAAEHESAEKAKLEAESLLSDYRAQMADARNEAGRIVADARAAGEAQKADIVTRAEAEADQIRARAQDEIVVERDRVSGELRRQVADLSIEVAERVVGGMIDADRQRQLVDRYIEELGGVQ